jgi:hypothetical protein
MINKRRMPALLLLFMKIRKQKEKQGMQVGKDEVKLFLIADNMILHTENPKYSTNQLLELINKLKKVAR